MPPHQTWILEQARYKNALPADLGGTPLPVHTAEPAACLGAGAADAAILPISISVGVITSHLVSPAERVCTQVAIERILDPHDDTTGIRFLCCCPANVTEEAADADFPDTSQLAQSLVQQYESSGHGSAGGCHRRGSAFWPLLAASGEGPVVKGGVRAESCSSRWGVPSLLSLQ